MSRRASVSSYTPTTTPLAGYANHPLFSTPFYCAEGRRRLPQHPGLRHNRSLTSLQQTNSSHYSRLSQPDLYSNVLPELYSTMYPTASCKGAYSPNGTYVPRNRLLPQPRQGHSIPRRFLKRCPQSDLAFRFQKLQEQHSTESTPSRELPVDPVYLALKQATGRYGTRRGSSAHNVDSHSPSPRNLSQVSLQDSGYVEMNPPTRSNPLLGSTPQLDHAGRAPARRRAPRLSQQMKSLSLDCAEIPPRINAVTRSPMRNKLVPRDSQTRLKNGSSDLSDWERSCSPSVNSRRGSANALASAPGYIVIHEYCPSSGPPLILGERLQVVDNGDPDWLHGFRLSDRTEHLISFPATCVARVTAGEQPMRILQNVFVPEQRLRMYRDQVVFAQPDSIKDGRVTVRTERKAFAPCPLQYLTLI